MAKKNKQKIEIVDKELTPTIIGKLDTKEKSPALLIIIFIIFIAVAIFMPDITNYINNYLDGSDSNVNVKPNNNANETEISEKPQDDEEITFYDYTTELAITHESFTMSNIVVAENAISFDIKNDTNQQLNLNNNKYFLEIYSSDTTLIQRIKISYGVIEANSKASYSYTLDENVSSNLAKLLIITKTEADYPEVTLTKDELNNGILSCTKGYEEITYIFSGDYLISISDIVNYPFSNTENYLTDLQNYQLLAATYNNYDGVSSTLITLDTGFTFTTLIELQDIDVTKIENNNYYNYRTQAKTVKFETESNGFICS